MLYLCRKYLRTRYNVERELSVEVSFKNCFCDDALCIYLLCETLNYLVLQCCRRHDVHLKYIILLCVRTQLHW